MGGGDIARYVARHGSARVSKFVLLSCVTPLFVKTADHDGVDKSVPDPNRCADAVLFTGLLNEVAELERTIPYVLLVEDALRQAAQKPRHSVLQNATAGREERGARRDHGAEPQKIVLVASRAVKDPKLRSHGN
ncbi:hypothetical protein JOE50_003251 [Bradyrhizobium japonicum]|nr:hypothetical protein [Bradyrhizobium japonicum]